MEKSYAQRYVELWTGHWWWRYRWHVVVREVHRLLGEPCRADQAILDIGCSGGVGFDDLSKLGAVSGIEPDPVLANSVPRWRHAVEHSAFGPDYLSVRVYRLVLMLDVLEHIADDLGAARALWRLLEPGGHALITVPALGSLWSVHDIANHHYRRYERRSLTQLFLRAGFRVLRSRYLFGWPVGPLYLRKVLIRQNPREYHVRMPSRLINNLLYRLCHIEEHIVEFLGASPPLGSSLLLVAQRPQDGART